MSAGFYVRSVFTILAGALIVLGVAYEERLVAFEQNIAARWRSAWAKNFGESSYGVIPRPKSVQLRAVSYRTRISSQIEVVHGGKPEFAPERRDDFSVPMPESAAKSA
ncbi:MAG: hypothetical protein LBT21_01385 [Oscillospiraceae bacterium]|jgi:hypothetical protein|nr:hypothetical protein [Oscillospiraceae bacterium]